MKTLMEDRKHRRQIDAARFKALNSDQCQLCFAVGADKRTLLLDCFYDISEAIPEAIDLAEVEGPLKGLGYYLRICKACRADLLSKLEVWDAARRARRDVPKDHDGNDAEAEDNHLADFIEDQGAISNLILRMKIGELLNELTPHERDVLKMRFGFYDGYPRTLEEVGWEFKVTRECIREIEAKALKQFFCLLTEQLIEERATQQPKPNEPRRERD